MLLPNNRYTLRLAAGGAVIEASFASAFEPAYTTPARIRSRYGALLAQAADLALWEAIYDASREIDYQTQGLDEIDSYVRERAAACRAALAWIRQALIRDAWDQASQRTLGDLSVRDDAGRPTDLLKLLASLQDECKRWSSELLGPDARTRSDWTTRLSSIRIVDRSWS